MRDSDSYLSGIADYRYPEAGDPLPPGGAKVLLLTKHGICVTGPWTSDKRYIAWSPLPKRDRRKEAMIEKSLPY
jgi:hypothetical protein